MNKANLESVLVSALRKATRHATPTPHMQGTSLGDDELAQVQGAGTRQPLTVRPALQAVVQSIDWLSSNPIPRPPPPPEPPDGGWTEVIPPDPDQPKPPPPEPGPPIPWNPNPFPPDPPEPRIDGAPDWDLPPDFPMDGDLPIRGL